MRLLDKLMLTSAIPAIRNIRIQIFRIISFSTTMEVMLDQTFKVNQVPKLAKKIINKEGTKWEETGTVTIKT
jgi:hypothetical protein